MAEGVLVLDKPAGWTSMDVCAKLRGILKEKRVGHGGTLDPMATGVLPVFVGRATKAAFFSENSEKEYLASLRLGVTTDTQDITGNVLRQEAAAVTEAELTALLPRFTGELSQLPPMYSAVKIGGKKLYELARKGQEAERKPRRITVYALEYLGREENGDLRLRVRCSKGTYVRTLCHDIGAALGCGGCLSALRRTEAAGFTLDEAVTLEEVQERGETLLRSVDSLFRQYPAYRIETEGALRRCLCGNPLTDRRVRDGVYRVYGPDGTFLALRRCEKGTLTSLRNFFGG